MTDRKSHNSAQAENRRKPNNAARFNPDLSMAYTDEGPDIRFGNFSVSQADVTLTMPNADEQLATVVKPGCHVIFAREGTGKSLLARMLVEAMGANGFALRMQEPEVNVSSPVDVENALMGFSSRHFADALKNPKIGFIMFDSLKATFRRKISTDSTTMSSGIESSFLEFLSDLSIAGILTGRSFVVVVNPGLIKDDVYTAVRGAMAGAATSVIEPKGIARSNGVIRLSVTSRVGDREYKDVMLSINERTASPILIDLADRFRWVLTGAAADLDAAKLANAIEASVELDNDPIVIQLGPDTEEVNARNQASTSQDNH